jgi:hypothetical protein
VEHVAFAKPDPRYPGQRRSTLERAQQLAKGDVAFAAHDDIDAEIRMRPGVGREAGVVAADDDPYAWRERADERDDLAGGTLERHHRQADDVRAQVRDEALGSWTAPTLARGRDRRWRRGDASRPIEPNAPVGMRTATVGVCSKESGIDSSRICMAGIRGEHCRDHIIVCPIWR